MNRKILIIMFGMVFIAIAGFFALQIPIKMRYDNLRDQLLEATYVAVHPLDAEAAGFLESVRESWEVHNLECPDSVFSEVSTATGVDESVEGVVNFYTHEIPEYSFFNLRRNLEEGVRAAIMAVALPSSVDNRIYHNDGICFIKLSENLVDVFEDTDDGLGRTLYLKVKNGEQDDGGQPATRPESK